MNKITFGVRGLVMLLCCFLHIQIAFADISTQYAKTLAGTGCSSTFF